jgi:hypothetical protein
MKFNIGMLFALVATNRLAAAAPFQWNGKDADAAYVPKSNDSQDQKYKIIIWDALVTSAAWWAPP